MEEELSNHSHVSEFEPGLVPHQMSNRDILTSYSS